jgi:hypothetical protein
VGMSLTYFQSTDLIPSHSAACKELPSVAESICEWQGGMLGVKQLDCLRSWCGTEVDPEPKEENSDQFHKQKVITFEKHTDIPITPAISVCSDLDPAWVSCCYLPYLQPAYGWIYCWEHYWLIGWFVAVEASC